MFVGHYAAALAAKAAEPRAPLWTLVAGAQLLDIGWSVLVMAGVERLTFDASLPGSPLVLEHMPWTHSLPAALAWSAAAAFAAMALLKLPRRAAVVIGLVVFSHWLADLLVHRPDLSLGFGGEPKLGLGLWNWPVPEQALEIGLLALAGMAWAGQRVRAGDPVWPAAAFVALLVVIQVVGMFSEPAGAVQFGATALAVYLLLAAVAWPFDRRRRATSGS
ncbi:hypothetical protein [Phenylobacterium sp. J367]|uniref:hypothetical protein n=1 Tax=Phenylobacterium sp. J367 TaxID=2898435 RepID=UPI002151735C|nr:hypothetical protein [Phenylobacterium sp. J367]MCR5878465.1 hypothetical protein [Phenylobacterium sp. J367]